MSTILIIDDEEPFRLMLEELFIGEGYRVHGAANGEQGVRLARAHRPDIILTDVDMPGGNGLDALRDFRRIEGFDTVPVIMMTGKADLAGMRQAMELGADDYLAKPFELTAALRIVDQHLAKATARRAAAASELQAAGRNLSELLPRDLVDPLHEIIGVASVLEVDANLLRAEDAREFARTILQSAEKLNRKIENFAVYSQLEAGTLRPSANPDLDIAQVVRDTAEHTARRNHRHGTLRFTLAPLTTTFDRDLLAKIVQELVDNACRYSIASEPIDIQLSVAKDTFTLVVADHGMGIPAASGDAVRATPGHLGLALARRLTELLAGTWELDNEPRRGVRLSLTFPR